MVKIIYVLAFITNIVTDGWEERKERRKKGNEIGEIHYNMVVCDTDVDYHLYRYELLNKKS